MTAPDLSALEPQLREGARALGVVLPDASVVPLLHHIALLLKWNRTINLTAITEPIEVLEKHLLDSLAVAALVPTGRLLDAGTGGGFPGVPIRLVRPDVEVVLVDSVAKKVAFLKSLAAELRLTGVRAAALRLAGQPDAEGLGRFEGSISRAFAAPQEWLALARPYLAPGGRAIAMAGPRDPLPEQAGELELIERRDYALPFSGAERHAGLYRLKA